MSMHKVPLTPTEEAGFHAHGLQRNIGKPSQLADVFRQGVAWGIAAERERLRVLVEAVRDANFDAEDGDTFRLLAPGQERAWLALLAGLKGPNK